MIEVKTLFKTITKLKNTEDASKVKNTFAVRDKAAKAPIWQRIRQRVTEVPASEIEKLPHDGAEQHDHYLYASPKKADS